MTLKDTLIPALAIIVIGALTALALYKGINGALFISAISIIAGVAGYKIAKLKKP